MRPVFYRPPAVNENLTCRFKRRFATQEEAQAANRGHRPYRCPYCGHWHLTSKGVARRR